MIYHVWLSRLNISRRKSFALASMPGGAKAAFEASPRELASFVRLNKRDIEELSDKSLKAAEKIIKDCRLAGIDIITANDERYPDRLKQIYDPPTVLYARGALPEVDRFFAFAVVGSRSPLNMSTGFAEKVAGALAEEGYLIVSGLAKGIDGTAHKAALDRGFPTVAVYGTAIDRDYPPENRSLAERVVGNGAIISENPPGFETFPSDFRIRNRLISGLSMGVLVVQAGERSGSLNTANFALEQGRDVFVMPGPPGVDAFLGSNKLIKDGACLTGDASDIILACKECAKSFEKVARTGQDRTHKKEKTRALTPDERTLLSIVDGRKNADRIIEESGMPAQKVTALLTYLELSGVISQLPGQIFIKK